METIESGPGIMETKENQKCISLESMGEGSVLVTLSQETLDQSEENTMGYASAVADSFERLLEGESELYEVILNEDSSIIIRPLNPSHVISEDLMDKLQGVADDMSSNSI